MLLLFTRTLPYNDIVYEAGKVYDIPEENGVILRWLKRGCVKVESEVQIEQQVAHPKEIIAITDQTVETNDETLDVGSDTSEIKRKRRGRVPKHESTKKTLL